MKLRPMLYVLFAVIVLGVIITLFKPHSSAPSKIPQTENQKTKTSLAANKKTFTLVVKNKKRISGNETLQATEGDIVTIQITADVEDELHLHGYDKSVELKKNTQESLTFTADKTGRFPFELEESKIELGVLEVQPK